MKLEVIFCISMFYAENIIVFTTCSNIIYVDKRSHFVGGFNTCSFMWMDWIQLFLNKVREK